MTSLFQSYAESFSYGDVVSKFAESPKYFVTFQGIDMEIPFTRERIFLSSTWTHLFTWVSSIAFVLWVTIIAPALKPKDKKVQDTISFWHYTLLCLYSAIACGATFYLMYTRGEFTDLDGFFCNEVPDWYRVLSISFMFSKYWEWLDTAILVWNGKSIKQIGFLHFYHHMTTVFLFLFTMNNPGTDKIGLLLNGFVHTLMYYHYAFRLPKMFRPLITLAQIIQLFLGTLSHNMNIHTCQKCVGYVEAYPLEFVVPYLFVPVYLVAFVHFFYITYISPPPARPRLPAAEKKID